MEVDDKMPQHEYYEYFGPDYSLHVAPSNMENKNSRQILEEIRSKLLDYLSKLQHAPSVQFQERPPDTEMPEVCSMALVAIFCPSPCLAVSHLFQHRVFSCFHFFFLLKEKEFVKKALWTPPYIKI